MCEFNRVFFEKHYFINITTFKMSFVQALLMAGNSACGELKQTALL